MMPAAFDEWGRPVPYRVPATREEKRRELACDIHRLKSLPPATMNAKYIDRWRREEISRLRRQLYALEGFVDRSVA